MIIGLELEDIKDPEPSPNCQKVSPSNPVSSSPFSMSQYPKRKFPPSSLRLKRPLKDTPWRFNEAQVTAELVGALRPEKKGHFFYTMTFYEGKHFNRYLSISSVQS